MSISTDGFLGPADYNDKAPRWVHWRRASLPSIHTKTHTYTSPRSGGEKDAKCGDGQQIKRHLDEAQRTTREDERLHGFTPAWQVGNQGVEHYKKDVRPDTLQGLFSGRCTPSKFRDVGWELGRDRGWGRGDGAPGRVKSVTKQWTSCDLWTPLTPVKTAADHISGRPVVTKVVVRSL